MILPEDFTFLQGQLWLVFGPILPWLVMAFLITGLWFMFLIVMLIVADEIAAFKKF